MPCTFNAGKPFVPAGATSGLPFGATTGFKGGTATFAAAGAGFAAGLCGAGAGTDVGVGFVALSRATARGKDSPAAWLDLRAHPRAKRNAARPTMATSAAQTMMTGSGSPDDVGGGAMVRNPPAGTLVGK